MTSRRAAEPQSQKSKTRGFGQEKKRKRSIFVFWLPPFVRTSCERTHDALLTAAAQSGRGDDNVDGFRRIRSVGSVGRIFLLCCELRVNLTTRQQHGNRFTSCPWNPHSQVFHEINEKSSAEEPAGVCRTWRWSSAAGWALHLHLQPSALVWVACYSAGHFFQFAAAVDWTLVSRWEISRRRPSSTGQQSFLTFLPKTYCDWPPLNFQQLFRNLHFVGTHFSFSFNFFGDTCGFPVKTNIWRQYFGGDGSSWWQPKHWESDTLGDVSHFSRSSKFSLSPAKMTIATTEVASSGALDLPFKFSTKKMNRNFPRPFRAAGLWNKKKRHRGVAWPSLPFDPLSLD